MTGPCRIGGKRRRSRPRPTLWYRRRRICPAEALTDAETAKDDDEDQAEALEDVEFAGKQYRLPKELKSALMMHAAYTRKTQAVAEGRRALESGRMALQQQAETHQKHIRDVACLVALDEQLATYENLDWQKLEAEDPFKAQSGLRTYTMLKNQRDGLLQQISIAEQKRAIETHQHLAKRFDEVQATLAREIKGWNEVSTKLVEFATENGVSQSDLAQFALHVPLVKLLHKAWLGDQLIRKQKAAAAKSDAEANPLPEPLKQIAKGRSAPANSGLSDNLSVDEWVKRRNTQIQKGV